MPDLREDPLGLFEAVVEEAAGLLVGGELHEPLAHVVGQGQLVHGVELRGEGEKMNSEGEEKGEGRQKLAVRE